MELGGGTGVGARAYPQGPPPDFLARQKLEQQREQRGGSDQEPNERKPDPEYLKMLRHRKFMRILIFITVVILLIEILQLRELKNQEMKKWYEYDVFQIQACSVEETEDAYILQITIRNQTRHKATVQNLSIYAVSEKEENIYITDCVLDTDLMSPVTKKPYKQLLIPPASDALGTYVVDKEALSNGKGEQLVLCIKGNENPDNAYPISLGDLK